MDISISRVAGAELAPIRDQIVAVYAAAFGPPPYNETAANVADFAETLAWHAKRTDFRCCVARTGDYGPIEGFAYGFTGRRGQWWTEVVARAMPPEMAEEWLGGHFELTDLAVHPRAQGHGIGGRLHDALLEGLPHRRVLLSTIQQETVAQRLYRRRGWVVLVPELLFPTRPFPFLVMGLDRSQVTGHRGTAPSSL